MMNDSEMYTAITEAKQSYNDGTYSGIDMWGIALDAEDKPIRECSGLEIVAVLSDYETADNGYDLDVCLPKTQKCIDFWKSNAER